MLLKKRKLLKILIYFYSVVWSNCFFANALQHVPDADKIFYLNISNLTSIASDEIAQFLKQKTVNKIAEDPKLEIGKKWTKRVKDLEEEYKKIKNKSKKKKSNEYFT